MNRWVNASGHVLFALAVLMIAGLGQISAQTTVSADGVIESTVGGFKFPDGSMQATAAAGGAPVEDTGQTGCWDTDGVSRPCAGTGEDGELLAGVAWPTSRFTDNGDGTATDNLTGLIWLKDANCPAGGMTWQLALDWVHDLNTESPACTDYSDLTFTDWRLTSICLWMESTLQVTTRCGTNLGSTGSRFIRWPVTAGLSTTTTTSASCGTG